MRRFTTPTLILEIDKPELIDVDTFYVTIKQGDSALTIMVTDRESTATGVRLSVDLSQLQTAGFSVGRASVQVNWMDGNVRGATQIAVISITDNLLNQVID